jgi:hypothetical protein
MLPREPAVLIGPDDEVVTLNDEDNVDDEDAPSSLDHEALTDDAC